MPKPINEPDYGADNELRRVRSTGEIRWQGNLLFVSEALIGETVAIRTREDGHHLVHFVEVPLLLIDRKTGRPARFGPGRPPGPKAKHSPNPSGM